MAPPTKYTSIVYKYLHQHKQFYIAILAAFIFVSLAIHFLYNHWPQINKHSTSKDTTNISNASKRNKPASIMFFNANWCKYCTKAKPEWKAFVDKYNGETINGYTIDCIGGENGTNCTDTNDPNVNDAIQHYNIEHYPTIKLKKDDLVIDFDGQITQSNLSSFVTSSLS